MLDQVIGAHLLYAEAERRKLTPTPEQVAAQVKGVRSRFPSEEVYRQQLASQGMTEEDVEEDIARNLAIQTLVASDVGASGPTAEEERRFYDENAERMKRPAQVRVRHILVGAGGDATPEQRQAARKEAESLRARVAAGEDFAKLAGESSDDPSSRPQGGLLPWFGRGEMVPPFEQAALALEPGQVSEVVESPFGFHVIRLEERRAETVVPFEEARPQIRELLARRHSRDALRAKVDGLRKKAKVEVLF
jgi:peptidyl-prolyl cis-trans isomerase C